MSSEREPKNSLNEATEQIVRGLKALDNLAQVALRDHNARIEMQRQLGLVAKSLTELTLHLHDNDFGNRLTWLSESLHELAAKAELGLASDEPSAEDMSEEEASRRLSLTVPIVKSDEEGSVEKRRTIVASLEQLDSALSLINTATHSFDRNRWSVTNLGHNVPIMALTSNVKEIKPGVLVLTVARGQLLRETGQLIQDLKRNFVGLKVIAVGPPFETNSRLGELLGVDLYAPEAEKTAELAEQALNPLNRLASPLALELEGEGEEEAEESSPIEDVPTSKPSKEPVAE